MGWAPSRVVRIPDDAGTGNLAAAAVHWVPKRRAELRSSALSALHRDVGGADRRAGMACFRLCHGGFPLAGNGDGMLNPTQLRCSLLHRWPFAVELRDQCRHGFEEFSEAGAECAVLSPQRR
ncbi:unnamed protein product [Lampetra fluviatilis]